MTVASIAVSVCYVCSCVRVCVGLTVDTINFPNRFSCDFTNVPFIKMEYENISYNIQHHFDADVSSNSVFRFRYSLTLNGIQINVIGSLVFRWNFAKVDTYGVVYGLYK